MMHVRILHQDVSGRCASLAQEQTTNLLKVQQCCSTCVRTAPCNPHVPPSAFFLGERRSSILLLHTNPTYRKRGMGTSVLCLCTTSVKRSVGKTSRGGHEWVSTCTAKNEPQYHRDPTVGFRSFHAQPAAKLKPSRQGRSVCSLLLSAQLPCPLSRGQDCQIGSDFPPNLATLTAARCS